MGLRLVLETERGEPIESVEDPKNLLHRLLPSAEDRSFQLLRFIDWYGNTVFNELQIDTFLVEWERLKQAVQAKEESALLNNIEDLARRCKEEPHLYLKFYGD
ncbi:MAG: hypothetical protein ACR2H4_07625 [Pyrinomonadaceae bacterium]